MPRIIPCPQCGKDVTWTAKAHWRPFCSQRCQLIDLGEWFTEEHRISEPEQPDPSISEPWGDKER